MKSLILISLIMLHASAFAETKCFLAIKNGQILSQEGNCKSRHSPASTFKVAISLMGYDSGILIDEFHPEWPFKEGYLNYMPSWKQAQNPTTWIKYSCVWYSQLITQQLGLDKFESYVSKFHYGNMDISGDAGQDNGLTNSWLASSLKISCLEQAEFLRKLILNQLPVSEKAQLLTKKILYQENFANSWKLYGKTGSGPLSNSQGKFAWFIGWVSPLAFDDATKDVIFVHYSETDINKPGDSTSAKEQVKNKLKNLLNESLN